MCYVLYTLQMYDWQSAIVLHVTFERLLILFFFGFLYVFGFFLVDPYDQSHFRFLIQYCMRIHFKHCAYRFELRRTSIPVFDTCRSISWQRGATSTGVVLYPKNM